MLAQSSMVKFDMPMDTMPPIILSLGHRQWR